MDGRVVADDTGITLYFSGFQARPEKREASPRHMPWASVESVTFMHRKGLRIGSLRVNVLGGPPPEAKPERDLNALMVNSQKHIDSCLLFAEHVNARLRVRTAAAPVTAAPGDQERSTREASDRMLVKFGGRRELRKLKDHLIPGEVVRYAASGSVENNMGIIALTDRRLLVLFHGMVRQRMQDIPLDNITSVQEKKGMVLGAVTILASGTQLKISRLSKIDQRSLMGALRARLTALRV